MTQEQLKAANELYERIGVFKNIINSLSMECGGEISIAQAYSSRDVPDMKLSVAANPTSQLGQSVRIILEATKRTLLSIHERELCKLEKEFEKI